MQVQLKSDKNNSCFTLTQLDLFDRISLIAVTMVLLGSFAKLRKAIISFFMSVRIKKLGSQWTDFYEILYI